MGTEEILNVYKVMLAIYQKLRSKEKFFVARTCDKGGSNCFDFPIIRESIFT